MDFRRLLSGVLWFCLFWDLFHFIVVFGSMAFRQQCWEQEACRLTLYFWLQEKKLDNS